jgi:hypothetical protein
VPRRFAAPFLERLRRAEVPSHHPI